jgi:hypothetical protein
MGRVSSVGPADFRTPVAAAVEEDANDVIVTSDHDPRVLSDVAEHEVARSGKLRLVSDEHPATSKDALKLELVDICIVVDRQRQHATLDIVVKPSQEPLNMRRWTTTEFCCRRISHRHAFDGNRPPCMQRLERLSVPIS